MKRIHLLVLGVFLAMAGRVDARNVVLKNYRELLAALEVITQLSASDPEIATVFRGVVERLPTVGKVEELSSPMVLATTELSGVFCGKIVKKEVEQSPGERVMFPYVDFTKGVNQFSPAEREKLLADLALLFWQRDATPEEVKLLDKVFLNAVGRSVTSSADLTGSLQVMCTVLGTSLQFFTK